MQRMLFNRIGTCGVTHSKYLQKGLRPDCVGRIGMSPSLKVICAFHQLSNGLLADITDDLFDISETKAALCIHHFFAAIIDECGVFYSRDPTLADITRTEMSFRKAGFLGCIGCLDCAGWAWKNCSNALQGIMVCKDGNPNARMDVICDLNLWI